MLTCSSLTSFLFILTNVSWKSKRGQTYHYWLKHFSKWWFQADLIHFDSIINGFQATLCRSDDLSISHRCVTHTKWENCSTFPIIILRISGPILKNKAFLIQWSEMTPKRIFLTHGILRFSHTMTSSNVLWQYNLSHLTWWRNEMETFSTLLAICAGNSPVNSLHKGQWCGALMFSLICVWINGWAHNREAGDLRRYRAHFNVIVMRYYDLNKVTDISAPFY